MLISGPDTGSGRAGAPPPARLAPPRGGRVRARRAAAAARGTSGQEAVKILSFHYKDFKDFSPFFRITFHLSIALLVCYRFPLEYLVLARVHGTIERTTGMLGVRSAANLSSSLRIAARRRCFSTCAGSVPQSIVKLKSLRRSRKLETAFHSPATTFARHCEVNVPDLPLRLRAENLTEPVRSRTPPLRSVFEAEPGRILRPLPVALRRSPALLRFHSISTPLQAYLKSPPDQSVQPSSSRGSLPDETSACPLLPSALSFRISLAFADAGLRTRSRHVCDFEFTS
jgi:hypothetical protein